MDESHAASIVKRVKPRFVTILNVLEDQLDRFGDPANVRNDLGRVAQAATEGVTLNADDQNLLLMLTEFEGVTNVTWFGLNQALLSTARAGLGTAPTYLAPLERPDSATTGVAIHENQLDVELRTGMQIQVGLPNRGLHFAVDAVAALETAQRLLGSRFDGHLAAKVLSELPPVFARGELKAVGDEMVEFILVQNPPSFQLNLDNLTTDPEQIMLAIGTDVHDPSWMWTVDLKNLSHVDIVSGYNSSEAALLLAYSEIPVGAVVGDLDEALSAFLALPKPSRGVKTIIFSADSMRRTRRALGFTDPEDVKR
jgi:UDP-N-acetylmuramyl tripeptide synthase